MGDRSAVKVLSLGVAAGIAAGIVVLYLYGATQRDDKEAAQAELVQLAEANQAACKRNPTTATKVLGAGVCQQAKEIVERPPAEKGDRGATGARGPAGPQGPPGRDGAPGKNGATPACLLSANRCVGPTGAPGIDGKTGPTGPPGARGATGATGADGKDGADGAPGKDGAAGPAGPAGANGKDGAPGTPGADGKDGAAGRGIQSGPTCTGTGSDSYWLTRYTDDTEQRQDGPCRLQPLLPATRSSN